MTVLFAFPEIMDLGEDATLYKSNSTHRDNEETIDPKLLSLPSQSSTVTQ